MRLGDPNQSPTESTKWLLVGLNSIVTALNQTRENTQPMTNVSGWGRQNALQGVVSGTMLVTPNAIMFDPNVLDPLVKERGTSS